MEKIRIKHICGHTHEHNCTYIPSKVDWFKETAAKRPCPDCLAHKRVLFHTRMEYQSYVKNVSMTKISKVLGVSAGNLSKLYNGKARIYSDTAGLVVKIADVLDVDMLEIAEPAPAEDNGVYAVTATDESGAVVYTGYTLEDKIVLNFTSERKIAGHTYKLRYKRLSDGAETEITVFGGVPIKN